VTRGQFDLALTEAARAIEVNPSDAFALDTRGMTLLWLGRFEEATAAIDAALRFNPAGRGPNGQFARALSYYMLGRHGEALAVAEAACNRYPEVSFLHAIRAVVLAETGRADDARKAAAEVRRLEPFFNAEEFGNRFVQPASYARLQSGLRKAGL
jgi:tetratricopeptide (TPR) repeat protein